MSSPGDAGGGASSLRSWQRCMSWTQRCSNMRQLKALHAIFIAHGLHHNNYALSKLIVFCSSSPSGSLHYASLLFCHSPQPPNAFIYNTLIRAHARGPHPERAFPLFRLMVADPDAVADHHTFAFALSASANAASITFGRQIHPCVVKNGLSFCDNFVQTALIRFYAQCCLPGDAHQVFDEIHERDSIMWNVLINGYLHSGVASKALDLFQGLLVSDVRPDKFCIATGITACAHLGALRQGQWIHEYARKNGLADIFVGTALIDLYAKCGCIERAIETFEQMTERNVYSWAAIIGAFAMHGFAKEALDYFERMQKNDGIQPDGVVLLGVLTACSHAGLKEEGYHILRNMEVLYNLRPQHEHYSCMIDLLSRAGHLREAFELAQEMPMKPLASVWGTLLSGARMHGHVELAEIAAEELLKLEQVFLVAEDGVYVQLSNVYLSASRRDDARRVRRMIGSRGIRKQPGCSRIEIDGKLDEFVAGDVVHPRRTEILSMLALLHNHVLLNPQKSSSRLKLIS